MENKKEFNEGLQDGYDNIHEGLPYDAHDEDFAGEEAYSYVTPKPTFKQRLLSAVLEVVKHNLVWYVAGLVDGVILYFVLR